jgi:hypothetical protein
MHGRSASTFGGGEVFCDVGVVHWYAARSTDEILPGRSGEDPLRIWQANRRPTLRPARREKRSHTVAPSCPDRFFATTSPLLAGHPNILVLCRRPGPNIVMRTYFVLI